MAEARNPFDKAALEQFLAERDVPCPSCGYNLHALRADNCPECHAFIPFPFPLGVTTRRAAWYVTGLIGLWLGLSVNLALLGLLIMYFTPFVGETASVSKDALKLSFNVALDVYLLTRWRSSFSQMAAWRPGRRWIVSALMFPLGVIVLLFVLLDQWAG